MRVLFATVPEKSHLFNLVPLAWALRTAGHEVRIAGQPGVVDSIVSAGLTAVPMSTDHDWSRLVEEFGRSSSLELLTGFDPFTAPVEDYSPDFFADYHRIMVPTFAAFNDALVDDLVEFARQWRPDLVVWDAITFAGSVAARAVGAAHARVIWGSDELPRMRKGFLDRGGDDDQVAAWLGPIASKHGVEFDEELLTAQLSVQQIPEAMRTRNDHVPSTGMSFVPYNGPATVPHWLRGPAERPRVCVTLGTTMERLGVEFMSMGDLLDAVADLDVEVVATMSAEQREALSSLPDNVRVVEFVPLHVLLPTCAAVVHHCGSGTYTTALASGVPQLAMPQRGFSESVLISRRMEDMGVALHEVATDATPEGVRGKLTRLLTEPSFAEAARRVRDGMRADPTPAEVVVALEQLAGRGR